MVKGISRQVIVVHSPDPKLFETREAWLEASANAHYIWYYFAAIGVAAAIGLILYEIITKRIDAKKI
jgi:SpoU rRNA methylase family enzyme